MFLNSIDNKPEFTTQDGSIIRDLTASMFDFKVNNFVPLTVYKVPVDYVMRPDLISQATYNNTLYTEYILKYNGYSNPFTVNAGDTILIPELNEAKKTVVNPASQANDAERIRNGYKYIDPTKIPKNDNTNFDNRNLKQGVLPPNIAEEGQKQVTERNGRVYFGENIGQSACLKNGMTQSEFLTQVIKST